MPLHSAPAKQARQLIDELTGRVVATAGRGASVTARRRALRRVLDQWAPNSCEREICRDGHDVLGSTYEAVLSGAERRADGQFYTPHYAADLMATWLLLQPLHTLLDPAVGTGRLLYRAGIKQGPPGRMVGLDKDPLAVLLARRNLEWRGLARTSEIVKSDFLSGRLPQSLRRYRPDGAIVNPPYSRHHAVSPTAKMAIHAGFERRLGVRFSRLAALHALFLVRTLEVCAPGARIAYITPGDWLDASYGGIVKDWVLSTATVEGLVFFPENTLPFGESVMSSGVISLFRKHQRHKVGRSLTTRVVHLPNELPPIAEVIGALVAGGDSNGLRATTVELTAREKWSRPARRRRSGTPLAELARVRRGIATGNNSFFVVSERSRRDWRLPLDSLRLCTSGPRAIEGLDLTPVHFERLSDTAPRWVLACWQSSVEGEAGPLGEYLRHGREMGVANGYLASRRTPWYGLDRRDPPAILWPYFNRSRLRFIRNRAGAVALNTWLGIDPHDDVDADRLWQALNSPATLNEALSHRRSYAGMMKLEPRELGELRVRW